MEGYIPFDALLTEKIEGEVLNFKELPYLMNTRNISQCFSASMLKMMKREDYQSSNSKLLVFAPAFKRLAKSNPSLLALRKRVI